MRLPKRYTALLATLCLLTYSQYGAASPLVTADAPMPQGFDAVRYEKFMTASGANMFAYAVPWSAIETSQGQYNVTDTISNPMTLLYPQFSFKGSLLLINTIDSNVLTIPSFLQGQSFSSPVFQQQFLATLSVIANAPGANKITNILLGNEVDLYLSANPDQLPAFLGLLQASITELHQALPGVKVGTITSFNALQNLALFQQLTQYSDFIAYTYYAYDGTNMEPMSQVASDLDHMAAAAGNKPFAFTEIGYSSSSAVNSSPELQAHFVQTVFNILKPFGSQVSFIEFSSMADEPSDSNCQSYASSQDFAATSDYCAFFDNLGLRTSDNQAKPAWNAFVQGIDSLNRSPKAAP